MSHFLIKTPASAEADADLFFTIVDRGTYSEQMWQTDRSIAFKLVRESDARVFARDSIPWPSAEQPLEIVECDF